MTISPTNIEYTTIKYLFYSFCPYNYKYCWLKLPIRRQRAHDQNYPILKAQKYFKTQKVITFLLIMIYIHHKIVKLVQYQKCQFLQTRSLWYQRGSLMSGLRASVISLQKIPDEPNAPSNPERIEPLKQQRINTDIISDNR